MDKLKNIIFWSLGVISLILIYSFARSEQREVKVRDLEIDIDYSNEQYFIKKEEVQKIIHKEYPYLDSLYLQEINIKLLEEKLDNHPSIRKAEVFSALDGILRIEITQKMPVARFMHSGSAYYLDAKGDSMPLSPNFSARVPLVTGHISSPDRAEMFQFLNALNNDEFFHNFFEGVEVKENGEWILFPKPGHHKVLLGKPEEVESKLRKLKIFYLNAVNSKSIDSIKTINLKYKGQVICRKYK